MSELTKNRVHKPKIRKELNLTRMKRKRVRKAKRNRIMLNQLKGRKGTTKDYKKNPNIGGKKE